MEKNPLGIDCKNNNKVVTFRKWNIVFVEQRRQKFPEPLPAEAKGTHKDPSPSHLVMGLYPTCRLGTTLSLVWLLGFITVRKSIFNTKVYCFIFIYNIII